jgi:uncharacterized protein
MASARCPAKPSSGQNAFEARDHASASAYRERPSYLEGDGTMKELVEYIAKSIVTLPDAVLVKEETDANNVILKLEVAPEDRGRVIGKQGRVAQAMRTLLRVAAVREGVRVQLEIL